MKSFFTLYIAFFILASFATLEERTLKVKIQENSEISIKGTSNVHSFECTYQEDIELTSKTIELVPNPNSFKINKAKLHLTAKSFDCGGRRINNDFKDILKADQFPHVDIQILSISPNQNQYVADIEVKIAGHSKNYKLHAKNPKNNYFTGNLSVDITDFGLESPKKVMGLIKVNELINIKFNLYIEVN